MSFPIIYNNQCYPIPLKFTMTTYCPNKCSHIKKKSCEKKKKSCSHPCLTPCSNPYQSYLNLCSIPNNNFIFPSIYIFQLTEVSYNNYTFTISTIDSIPKIIAHGTAYQIGNILFLTFLDDNNNFIGSGVIEFKNFNYCKQGFVSLQGCIKTILPQCYIVNPTL